MVPEKAIVTVDAINCQKETAMAVIGGGGDYVFALKGNQGRMNEEARLYLDEIASQTSAEVEKIEKGHGRLEIRQYWQSDKIKRFADLKQWPGSKIFGMVNSTREMSDDQVTEERHYYISSLSKGEDLFSEAVRACWGVENKVLLCLDVIFGEDQNRARSKYASTNPSTLRKMVFNIL